jgi:hypothetical protein
LSTANNLVISNANRARAVASTVAIVYYASGTPATAEYDVEAVARPITVAAGASDAVVAGRMDTAALTFYCVRYVTATTNWRLTRFVTGTATDLGTNFTQTLTADTDYTVKLEIRDATKKVFIDGVERISSTDNTITAAGLAGMRMVSGAVGDAAGMHIDSFTASDVPSGAVTVPPGMFSPQLVPEAWF